MSIKDRVTEDIRTAMFAKDETRLSALRMIKAEILKAEKEKGQAVDDTRAMTILQTMVKQRRDSITQFEKAGRLELAEKEKSELEIITSYLPEPLTDDELKSDIDAVLTELPAPDPKQIGKIMGQVMARLKARGRPFDAQAANAMVRTRLGA